MTAFRPSCPSPVDLERGFWSDDEGLREHISSCVNCRHEWSSIGAMRTLAQQVDVPPASHETSEQLRESLVASPPPTAKLPSRRYRGMVASFAAAAAVVLAVVAGDRLRTETPVPAIQVPVRGRLLAQPGALYLRVSSQPNEIVRVTEGRLTIDVSPLRAGERFRVIAGDAEVEVRGTAFDVTVREDRLVAVRVHHGVVVVRPAGTVEIELHANDVWHAPPREAVAPPPRVPVVPTRSANSPHRPSPASQVGMRTKHIVARKRIARTTPPTPAKNPAATGDQHTQSGDAGAAPRAMGTLSGPQGFYEAGWAALRRRSYSAAANSFRQAIALSSDQRMREDARYWRGVALARAKRTGPAVHQLSEFLAKHPGSTRIGQARVMLGWLLLDRGNPAAADEQFRSALADPDSRVRASAKAGVNASRRNAP